MHIFPVHIFNPSSIRTAVRQRVLSGGQSLDGNETVIATDGGGIWDITYSGIQLRNPQQSRLWDAWAGYLAGGVTECLVPLVSLATAPRGFTGRHVGSVPSLFVDNDEWPQVMRYASPLIVASVGANAALRATVLNVVMTTGAEIKGGEKLSIGNRAYKIIRPLGGGNFQIEPPLREAVTLGAPVIFDWPMVKCKMRVGDDPIASMIRGQFSDGVVEINFVESVL
jgi:hypothetical protein